MILNLCSPASLLWNLLAPLFLVVLTVSLTQRSSPEHVQRYLSSQQGRADHLMPKIGPCLDKSYKHWPPPCGISLVADSKDT